MKQDIKWYGCLVAEDVRTFEVQLIQWARRNGTNANFIFDETSLNKISKLLLAEKDENHLLDGHIQISMPEQVKTMSTRNLVLKWYTVCGQKCILKSIQTKEGRIYYLEPKKWKDTTIWYAF